ncbi:MAG: hypothetical protein EX267_04640 [Acidimicrobiia bacterium]|nr:hypothetical protein [Acidimicrobiia bacterium]RZV45818.1 MAG: hypothetical protein EX267_04640 [Acidimicrobiia bacterium]
MGTSIRRTAVWLVLGALAIAGAAWLAMGASATIDAGAPPVTGDVTGELKIVKNLGGNWPDGAFVFTWECTDGQSGSATFPDDFTGANFETGEEYPIGTVCAVEETDGVFSVSDYNVTTHIEGTAGFQAINPRDVPINNSTGQNVIQYMNDPIERLPKQVEITKNVIGGPLSASDFMFEIFCDMGDYQTTVTIAGPGNSAVFDVPGTLSDCKVTETPVDDYSTTGDSGAIKTLNLQEPTEWVITNTWVEPEPEAASVRVTKTFEGPDDWKFGFAFLCRDFGNADTFVLGGGESSPAFTIPFHIGNGVPLNGEENGGPYTVCAVVEQALAGPWTVNVSVTGATEVPTVPPPADADFGAVAFFEVHPGDAIVVTFENIPSYGAQPPSGIPPEILVPEEPDES